MMKIIDRITAPIVEWLAARLAARIVERILKAQRSAAELDAAFEAVFREEAEKRLLAAVHHAAYRAIHPYKGPRRKA